MRIVAVGLALVLLSGCVGPGDLAKNEPTMSVTSSKDPKAYALCVFPQWQNARTDSSMVETQTGFRLLVASNNMADELLEVKKTAAGSFAVLYQRMAWSKMMGRSAIEAAVKSCR
ncbi:hypothetical protein [Pseudomonas piscis]|uniref:Lipoprotein n=1 Tax=Pseudomonas piscis TaxID=2614538 RepID=A0A7X1PM43_9PSED|nr:hypothetical protein [Pseudomonas piscis]MQA53740.1 hypothetical protein [Pseudomonas piscis]